MWRIGRCLLAIPAKLDVRSSPREFDRAEVSVGGVAVLLLEGCERLSEPEGQRVIIPGSREPQAVPSVQ